MQTLNKAFTSVVTSPEAQTFFTNIGLEPNVSTSAQLAEYVKTQTELWGRIIKESGLEKI